MQLDCILRHLVWQTIPLRVASLACNDLLSRFSEENIAAASFRPSTVTPHRNRSSRPSRSATVSLLDNTIVSRLDEAEIASTRITPLHDTAFVFGKVVLVSELLDHCMYVSAVHCFKNLLEFQRPSR